MTFSPYGCTISAYVYTFKRSVVQLPRWIIEEVVNYSRTTQQDTRPIERVEARKTAQKISNSSNIRKRVSTKPLGQSVSLRKFVEVKKVDELTHAKLNQREINEPMGELVWAHLEGTPYWPAVAFEGEEFGKSCKPGNKVVFWFGDHKISEICEAKLYPFVAYFDKYFVNAGKYQRLFRAAILEMLKLCAKVSSVQIHNEYSAYVDWAKAGFSHFEDPSRAISLPAWICNELTDVPRRRLRNHRRKRNRRGELFDFSDEEDDDDYKQASSSCPTLTYEMLEIPELKKITRKAEICFLLSELYKAKFTIDDICVACCDVKNKVQTEHPLIRGGLCNLCQEELLDWITNYGEDFNLGSCVLCGYLGETFICDEILCGKVYCTGCIVILAGEKELEFVKSSDPWMCYLCSGQTVGLLVPRLDWRQRLKLLYARAEGIPVPDGPTIKRPIRVLSLFDGIAAAKIALERLDIDIEAYYACEIEERCLDLTSLRHWDIQHLGDVRRLKPSKIREISPIDLVIGGSPCIDISAVNPARKGICSRTGKLFFEFVRILRSVQRCNPNRVFWLFENVNSMSRKVAEVMSTMFKCSPNFWDGQFFTIQRRPRLFWGNIPSVFCTPNMMTFMEHDCRMRMPDLLSHTVVSERAAAKRYSQSLATKHGRQCTAKSESVASLKPLKTSPTSLKPDRTSPTSLKPDETSTTSPKPDETNTTSPKPDETSITSLKPDKISPTSLAPDTFVPSDRGGCDPNAKAAPPRYTCLPSPIKVFGPGGPVRELMVETLNTLTGNSNSLRRKKGKFFPIRHNGKGDVMWVTELESCFGLPDNYTDLNMSTTKRIDLIGRSWSIPVIAFLFQDLLYYFSSGDPVMSGDLPTSHRSSDDGVIISPPDDVDEGTQIGERTMFGDTFQPPYEQGTYRETSIFTTHLYEQSKKDDIVYSSDDQPSTSSQEASQESMAGTPSSPASLTKSPSQVDGTTEKEFSEMYQQLFLHK